MKRKRGKPALQFLDQVTPYRWQRNYRGDLCGVKGQPIYFCGDDAVIIEYAPEMAAALDVIRATAESKSSTPALALLMISQMAVDLIERMQKAHADYKWCRGTIK